MEEIFRRIPPSSSSAVSLVSKRWLNLHRSSKSHLSLRLSSPNHHNISLSSFLSHFPFLTSLSLSGNSLSPSLPSLSSCPSLRHLRLLSEPVSVSSLLSLSSHCPLLVSLSVSLSPPFSLLFLSRFTSLKHLSLHFTFHSGIVQNPDFVSAQFCSRSADSPFFNSAHFVSRSTEDPPNLNFAQFNSSAETPNLNPAQFNSGVETANLNSAQFSSGAENPYLNPAQFSSGAENPYLNPAQFSSSIENPNFISAQYNSRSTEDPNLNFAQFNSSAKSPNLNPAQFNSSAETPNLNSAQFNSSVETAYLNSAQFSSGAENPNLNPAQFNSSVDTPNCNNAQFNSSLETPNFSSAQFNPSVINPNFNSSIGNQNSASTQFNSRLKGSSSDVELQLETLTLSCIKDDDYTLNWLYRSCKNLKKLIFRACEGIGDNPSSSSFINCIKYVEEVELRTCRMIIDVVLLKLAENSKSLKTLLVYDGGCREGLLRFIERSECDLQKLDLRLPLDLDNRHLSAVAEKFRGLTSLRLQSCCLVTGEGLKAICLRKRDGLEELALMNCDVAEREPGLLTTLAQCLKGLKKLDLSYNEMMVDKEFVSMIVSCGDLKELKLRGCRGLSSLALVSISKYCKSLELVDIMYCCGIEAKDIELFVSNSPRLRQLIVEENKLSDQVKIRV